MAVGDCIGFFCTRFVHIAEGTLKVAEFSQNFAVVIGIDQYGSGLSSLQTAVNDVKAIAQMLSQDHHYQVMVLVNQQATLAALQHLLVTVLPQQIKPDSRLLFYFAGHGIALNGEDGPQGYLIPQDASAGDTRSYLAMPALQSALVELPCRHFLGILDCCFAGAFRWSSTRDVGYLPAVIHKERYDRFVRDPAWQILTSAACDQKALDAFSLSGERGQVGEHSPFATALIEALQGKADVYPAAKLNKPAGDGVTTATELYMYLRDRVEIATEAHALRQTPGIHPLKQHDKGEYIFLTPGHRLNLPPAPPLDESKNPYRGLQAFEAEHSGLFFGRSALTQKLKTFVEGCSFTVVLGASGAGKSSLVRAGLIPQLKQSIGEKWQVLSPIRPGEFPFQALNQSLSASNLPLVDSLNLDKTFAQSLEVWDSTNPHAKLLIFIDQVEEVITLCADGQARQLFFQQILTAVHLYRHRVRLVISLRSDFEPQVRDAGLAFMPKLLNALGRDELEHRWQQGRFIVPAMTRTELREAIEKPAETRVLYFESERLVEQLIDEVANMPGALPLLSFALSELYLKYLERQQAALCYGRIIERSLTEADYAALGGVIQSLTQRADEEYQLLVQQSSEYGQAVCHVMLRMVAISGGEIARRRVLLSELAYPSSKNNLCAAVIARFSRVRLLVEGQDSQGNACIEPAHDALVRGWQQLQGWLTKEKNLPLQRRLSAAAVEWKTQQQSRQFLWDTDPYLEVLDKTVLKSDDNNWLNQIETVFVQQSLLQKRQSRFYRRSIISAAAVLLSVTTGSAVRFAINSQNRLLETSSSLADAMFLSNEALEALGTATKTGESLKATPHLFVGLKTRLQVINTLRKITYGISERNRMNQETGATSVSVSPEGREIASGSEQGTVQLWSADGKALQRLPHGEQSIEAVEYSHDGQILISADKQTIKIWHRQADGNFVPNRSIALKNNMSVAFEKSDKILATSSRETDTIQLWDLDGKLLATWNHNQHIDRINDLSFSPDGQTLASGSADKTVKLWNVKNGQSIAPIETNRPIFVSQFIDSQTLAVAEDDGTISLWDTRGTLKRTFEKQHQSSVDSLAVSGDGKNLASVGKDRTVRLWRIADGQLLHTFNGHEAETTDVSFLDSQRAVSASVDGSVRVWQMDERMPTFSGSAFSFRPDGRAIAIAQDRCILVWQLNRDNPEKLPPELCSETEINQVDFSPQGNRLAVADVEGAVILWDLEKDSTQDSPTSTAGHAAAVTTLSFAPDGQQFASGSLDGTVKLWDAEGRLIDDRFEVEEAATQITFSPNGQLIAWSDRSPTIQLRHLDKIKDRVSHESPDGHTSAVLDIDFSPDGRRIASASEDGTIKIWTVGGRLIETILVDSESVNNVEYSPDGDFLISGRSRDNAIQFWTPGGEALQTLPGSGSTLLGVGFDAKGTTIAIADTSGVTLQNWDLDRLLDVSCSWLGPVLNSSEISYSSRAKSASTLSNLKKTELCYSTNKRR